MRTLGKILINEGEPLAQSLSRERMKAIRGGGGACYLYCTGNGHTTLTITSECNYNRCKDGEKPYCHC